MSPSSAVGAQKTRSKVQWRESWPPERRRSTAVSVATATMSGRISTFIKRAALFKKSDSPFAARASNSTAATPSTRKSLASSSLRSSSAPSAQAAKVTQSIKYSYEQTREALVSKMNLIQVKTYETSPPHLFPSFLLFSASLSAKNVPQLTDLCCSEGYWVSLMSGLITSLGYYLLDDGAFHFHFPVYFLHQCLWLPSMLHLVHVSFQLLSSPFRQDSVKREPAYVSAGDRPVLTFNLSIWVVDCLLYFGLICFWHRALISRPS